MNRYEAALCSAAELSPTLLDLSCRLTSAVVEASAYRHDPLTDPAVLLISMQIAFATHTDVAPFSMYETLIESCQVNAIVPSINPMEIN